MNYISKDGDIVASMATRRYLYFARNFKGTIWFGIKPHGSQNEQFINADMLQIIDRERLFLKPKGVYFYGPYRFTITVDRIWAIDTPDAKNTYVGALKERLIMKLLFFIHSYSDIYNDPDNQ